MEGYLVLQTEWKHYHCDKPLVGKYVDRRWYWPTQIIQFGQRRTFWNTNSEYGQENCMFL